MFNKSTTTMQMAKEASLMLISTAFQTREKSMRPQFQQIMTEIEDAKFNGMTRVSVLDGCRIYDDIIYILQYLGYDVYIYTDDDEPYQNIIDWYDAKPDRKGKLVYCRPVDFLFPFTF